MKPKYSVFSLLTLLALLSSCSVYRTGAIHYSSIRTTDYKDVIPSSAVIAVGYQISHKGEVAVVVRNLTEDIMIIDQTKSFFIDNSGLSTSYYDPTTRVVSNTTSTSRTGGGTLALGAVASILNIGGIAGTLMNAATIAGARTRGESSTNTTYFQDQPQISLGPHGHGAMSKLFKVEEIGKYYSEQTCVHNYSYSDSYCKFRFCITYSIDGGKTFDRVVTDFYVNSYLVSAVKEYGKTNAALREIFINKPDALNEQWFTIKGAPYKDGSNKEYTSFGTLPDGEGYFIDYK